MSVQNDFEVLQTRQIDELASKVTLYRHKASGAEVLSLENRDENKVFGVAFRTVPPDSTGVAHILEHVVLAGSQKYPVKEPFIELVKGSLASYVNASTFEDKTIYPLASQNLQDFYNLIDVYLDAVFNPLLARQTFEREGWHFSLEQPQGSLSYKGVVFNEMKGQLANSDYTLIKEITASLFPDTPYAHQSGGHPESIPDLSFDGFIQFYRTHYHPANARFFFYGDDPPDRRFDRILPYLELDLTRRDTPQVDLQPRFESPRRIEKPYPGSNASGAARHALAVSWMLDENADPGTALANRVLNHILMGTAASPLRKALIESGFGEDVFGSGVDEGFGLWTMLRQLYFSAGLKGVAAESVDQVEPLILETLGRLGSSPIEEAAIKAALNTIEFALRENNYGATPRGMILMIRALSTWKYGGDPISAIAFHDPLEQIKTRAAEDRDYFSSMIRGQLLENPHRVALHLSPDLGYLDKLEASEKSRLEAIAAGLSHEQRLAIYENAREIQQIQETPDRPEDLAKLPLLAIGDLDPLVKTLPLEVIEAGPGAIWFHPIPTYGINYLDLGFDLHSLPQEYLGYLSVFGRALLEMGTMQQDYVSLSQRIGSQTGGIRTAIHCSSSLHSQNAQAWLFLRGKSMITQSGELFGLLGDLLLEPHFDQPERFKQIALEEKAGLESSLLPEGHLVINRRLRSAFNEAGWVDEAANGVEALIFLRGLIQRIDEDWASVLDDLQTMHAQLVSRGNALFNLTLPEKDWRSIETGLRELRSRLPEKEVTRQVWTRKMEYTNEGLVIPAQVNYVGKGAVLEDAPDRSGALLVAGLLLRTTWLWERVRLQGGAYGAFCLYDPIDHGFTFLSYRDPRLLETLDTFDAASEFLSKLELDARELQKTIIGTIGRLDAYQLPDMKGFSSMARRLSGLTDAIRQDIRDQVLATGLPNLRAAGEALHELGMNGRVVLMGSQQAIDGAIEASGPAWMETLPIL